MNFLFSCGTECRADQLRKGIRHILVEHFQSVKAACPDKPSGFGQIVQMVLREILHLNDAACPPPGAVGSVKLKHTPCAAIGADGGLHRLIFFNAGFRKLLAQGQYLLQLRRRSFQKFRYSLLPRVSVSTPLSASHCFICCTELGLSSEVSSFIAWVSSERERPSI